MGVIDTVNEVNDDHDALTKYHEEQRKQKKLDKLVDVVFHAGDGHAVTQEEFENHENIEDLADMFSSIDFPKSFTLTDLFILLDWAGQKSIYRGQFVDSTMNFINGEHFQLDCQFMLSLNKVRRDVLAMRKEMRHLHYLISNDPKYSRKTFGE